MGAMHREDTNPQAGPPAPLSAAELAAEGGTALPDKEVMSLLDLNANLDLGLDLAAPVDLAIGANANVAAPINAAVDGNILSMDSVAQGESLQGAEIHQGIVGDATATGTQDSGIVQSGTAGAGSTAVADGTTSTPALDTTTGGTTAGALDGNLLNVNVDLAGDLNLTAPIDGAVAANANVAAPIDASVSANIGSIGSESTAVAHQEALISQNIDGNATATTDQTSTVKQ